MTVRHPMRAAVGSSWALLLGFAVLMLGDGLQGTLLAVRAALEGFPTTVTGIIMSTFYVGFLGGSLFASKILQRVGHIRAFAALASLASATIVVHAVFVTPISWAVLRMFSGFCFAGLYVVAESWLNDRATNETRGQLLSVYMVITYISVGSGQLLLNVASPLGYNLFILSSVLISVALVPLLLSAGPVPSFDAPSPVNVWQLFKISPLGVVGALFTGAATSAFFGMGPVYADATGLSVAEISIFMTVAVLGCVVLQWPIGRLSDKYDRRLVLTLVTLLAAATAFAAVPVSQVSTHALFALIGLFGGLSLTMYSLCIAHANDFLEPHQMIAASGGLVLASGIGAIIGPLAASVTMTVVGMHGFFWSLAAIHSLLGLFAIYRMLRRRSKPLAEQGRYAPTAARASQVALAVELDEYSYRPPPREN